MSMPHIPNTLDRSAPPHALTLDNEFASVKDVKQAVCAGPVICSMPVSKRVEKISSRGCPVVFKAKINNYFFIPSYVFLYIRSSPVYVYSVIGI